MTLRLKLDYAACEKLCVPAKAKLELVLTGARKQPARQRSSAAEARVPKSAANRGDGTPSIHAVRREQVRASRASWSMWRRRPVRGRVVRRGSDRAVGLAAAGAGGGAPAGLQRFAFELDGLPPGDEATAPPPAHGGRRRQGHRGRISARLIRRSALSLAPEHVKSITLREDTSMAIKVGDRVPNGTFTVMTAEGPKPKTTDELFKGKKVVLFAVPGAFTPTCSNNHLPGFVKNADAIKAKGIDTIAVTGVNDVFVMNAWKKSAGAEAIEFLADGSGTSAKAFGITADLTERGLGVRSGRYAMVVDDGVVKTLNVEDAPGKAEVSGAEICSRACKVSSRSTLFPRQRGEGFIFARRGPWRPRAW